MSIRPDELIKKYLNNTCTPEERSLLESWYNSAASSTESTKDNIDYYQLNKDIWDDLKKTSTPPTKIKWQLLSAAAACILICATFYFSHLNNSKIISAVASAKISPGSNKAELLLEDGSVIPLSDDSTKMRTKQSGAVITKLMGGILKYDSSPTMVESKLSFNVLRTPKGGQYQVDLPDGTRAWLNATSSLKFPTAFNGVDRIVEASGEVYFEVAVNKHKPFKVVSQGQTIVVLGTHFNLSAYADEQTTKTSLLEGSVKVISERKTVTIVPGEQSILNANTKNIEILKTDMEEVMAWRKGYFQFDNEDIKSIMRKLSRWYDIDINYTKNFKDQSFNGSVSRFEDATKVFKMLEYTGTIHFKVEGRRVTVMP